MSNLEKLVTAIWLETDHISCKVDYIGPKSYRIESISLEYQDKNTKEKKSIKLSGPKSDNDKLVTLIIYMPLLSNNQILNGKLTIGLVNQDNKREEHIVNILEAKKNDRN